MEGKNYGKMSIPMYTFLKIAFLSRSAVLKLYLAATRSVKVLDHSGDTSTYLGCLIIHHHN